MRVRTAAAVVGAALGLIAAALPTTPAHAAGTVAPQIQINRDFPDPDIVSDGTTWHAYATSSSGIGTVPHATSPSPTGPWTVVGNALDHKPAWARQNHGFWAPDVSQRPDGSWLMYFTGRHDASGRMCLGAATADSPDGPFLPTDENEPLVCNPEEGGDIDPSSFVDTDGKRYLLYKNDGNAVKEPAILWLQEVDATGLNFIGERTELLRNSAESDQGVIEAPTLVHRPEGYVLFFSAGVYSKGTYHTSYARSDTLRGTYTRAHRPLLTTETVDGTVNGPGGQDVIDNRIWFHGHLEAGGRGMYTAKLGWFDGNPVVRGSRVRYEAERGTLHDCVVRQTETASEGEVVAEIDKPTSWVETTVHVPVGGHYTVHISYAAGYGDAKHALSVNGHKPIEVSYPDRGWENWSEVSVDVNLKAGANKLRLTHLDKWAEIDHLEVA